MDHEFEEAIQTKNRDHLEKFIKNQFRHFEYDHVKKLKVCKHYLLDRCYADDSCQYSHEIVPEKVPDCKFFEQCTDYFCHFKHRDDKRIQLGCEDFLRGVEFDECNCKKRGVVQRMCPKYAAGFCPDGPDCKMAHPRWDRALLRADLNGQAIVPCSICGSFHIEIEMDAEDANMDAWQWNSASVLKRCHGNQSKVTQFMQWFQRNRRDPFTKKDLLGMVMDIAYDIIADQKASSRMAQK